MPEKTRPVRMKQAKKKGTPMALKASDVHQAAGESAHKAKKSGRLALGAVGFADRNVSARHEPGKGLTTRSKKLPEPVPGGSSTSRRKTLPSEAAAAYRKEGRAKKTTGRGDTTPLKAGKAYKRGGARKTSIRT